MDIVKKYNLPKYLKGKSFAEASKIINEKFKDRNDKISKDTRNELLSRLAQAQEELKAPEMGDQMFFGGNTSSDPLSSAQVTGMASQAAGMIAPLLDEPAGNILSSTAQGVSAGAVAGPVGSIVGGLVGGGLGLLQNSNNNKKEQEANLQSAEKANSQYSSDFAYGGKKYNIGGLNLLPDPIKKNTQRTSKGTVHYDPATGQPYRFWAHPERQSVPDHLKTGPFMVDRPINLLEEAQNKFGDIKSSRLTSKRRMPLKEIPLNIEDTGLNMGSFDREPSSQIEFTLPNKLASLPEVDKDGFQLPEGLGDKLKNIGIDVMRYAPALMNLKQLSDLEKPEYVRLDRMDNRYEKDLVDEQALINNVQQQFDNTRNAIANSSTGSVGALRSNLIGAQSNATNALSNAMLEAENINRGENRAEQQFNVGIDQTNLRQDTLEEELNARNQGVYDSNKSTLLSQLGNDIGNIGREARYREMIKEMGICYDARGRYICGTEERVPNDIKPETMAYGGKTNDDIFDDYLSKILAKKRSS